MTSLITLRGTTVRFPAATPALQRLRGARRTLDAVTDVDLEIVAGSALGIVGESGSGKTTLARVMVGLQRPSAGTVTTAFSPAARGDARPRVQMVFQDPSSSLDPRQTVRDAIAEVLRVHHVVGRDGIGARVESLVTRVGLPTSVLDSLPLRLSGGQRQRVSIARALASEPEVLIADEAVASLDVSVKAGILNLLRDLQRETGLTLVLITHDLATVGHACDEIAVMYLGRIVEHGPAGDVLSRPMHPYTKALLAAVPRLGERRTSRPLGGETPSPLDVPPGCAFAARCPVAEERCRTERPASREFGNRRVACHIA